MGKKKLKKGTAAELRIFGFSAAVLVVLLAVFYFTFHSVFLLRVVPTGSMVPTVERKDFTITNAVAYNSKDVSRFEVILFNKTDNKNKDLVKRVIGLPGETITFDAGRIYVNGELLEEPFLDDAVVTNSSKRFVVPSDCYFVLGDNRDNSEDSLDWSNPYVRKSDILGQTYVSIGLNGGAHLHFF